MNNGDIMILETIAQANRERYAEIEKQIPLEEIKSKALSMNITDEFPFEKALAKDGISYICEVKKASPSKGIIAEDFPYVQIAKDYENAGASAISVLTEPQWFKGENKYLQEISQNVKIPLLRKDFIFDEYQIAEAKAAGASAVLLIAKMLKKPDFKRLFDFAKSLSLDVLAEAHDEAEIEAVLDCGADIVGVNCRNLRTFGLDFSVSERLLKTLPDCVVKVAESGVDSRETLLRARGAGADAALVGTALMKEQSPSEALKKLLGAL